MQRLGRNILVAAVGFVGFVSVLVYILETRPPAGVDVGRYCDHVRRVDALEKRVLADPSAENIAAAHNEEQKTAGLLSRLPDGASVPCGP